MSLIVAKLTEHGIYIVSESKISRHVVSESKITGELERVNTLLNGISKIFLLDHERCIAFSGDIGRASEAAMHLSPQDSTQRVVDILQAASTQGDVSFLIAYLKPERQLIVIRNGSVLVTSEGWIGDYAAYSRYRDFFDGRRHFDQIYDVSLQALKMPDHVPEHEYGVYGSMFQCMAAAIYSGEIDSIGGFVIPVLSEQNHFRFGCYSTAFRRPIDPDLEQIGPEWKALQLEDSTAGGFSVVFDHIGDGFVVYIKQGKIAILFEASGDHVLKPTITQTVDEIDYVRSLERRFGPWQGALLIAQPVHFWKKAQALGKQGLLSDAIELYSEGIRRSSQTWRRASGSQIQYASLKQCRDSDGDTVEIPLGIAHNLKTAFYERGLCHYQIKQYINALQDCNDATLIDSHFSQCLAFKEHILQILGTPKTIK